MNDIFKKHFPNGLLMGELPTHYAHVMSPMYWHEPTNLFDTPKERKNFLVGCATLLGLAIVVIFNYLKG